MALLSPVDRLRVRARRIVRTVYGRPMSALEDLGDQLGFYGRALAWTPRTLRRYKKEVMRLLAEVTFGSGALAVIGGTVGVIAFLSFFTGTEVGLQGYAALDQLGTSAFTGFLSAYFNTREIAPLVAGPGAVGDRRLRVHRADRRHADQRGDRRPRGHGRALAAVPGHHPHRGRLRRRHPAVRAGAAQQLLRHPADHHAGLRPVGRHLRPLLQPVPATDRTCSGRSSRCSSSPS